MQTEKQQLHALHARILHFEHGTAHFLLRKCSKFQRLGQKPQEKASSSFFWWGTLPRLCLHWCHSRGEIHQAFPLHFCILQAIKNWIVGRPGDKGRKAVQWKSLTLDNQLWNQLHCRLLHSWIIASYVDCTSWQDTVWWTKLNSWVHYQNVVWTNEIVRLLTIDA